MLGVMIQPVEPSDEWLLDSEAIVQETVTFRVPAELSGERLDKVLAALLTEHSRGRIQSWIEQGFVEVNGVVQQRVRHIASVGDHLLVRIQPSDEQLAYSPEDVEFDVLEQSSQWLVVNKHCGLVVHPGAGNWNGTLLNGLLFRYPQLRQVPRAGIVHRLDKDTSGLMVIAKTPVAQTHLVRQLQARSVKRQYVALVHGHLQGAPLTIDRAIGRDPRVPVRMSIHPAGTSKSAITDIKAHWLGDLNGAAVTLVQCQLQTGRTHQIRVHLASLGHPLVGDVLYGGRAISGAARQMLHAQELSFLDPIDSTCKRFESDLAHDMRAVLSQIQWQSQEPGAVI
jgi:23S rRNA pseudouridine1911/1915/1917 synthase